MRILMVGRPPQPHWRLPGGAEVVVAGSGVPREDPAFGARYAGVPVPDPSDLEQLLCALIHEAGSPPEAGAPWWDFDAVYCDFEHALVNAAAIAALAGAQVSMTPGLATLARDKWRQKQTARAAGIATAPAELVTVGSPRLPALPPPLVVKPLLGSAARDVRSYDDADAARARAVELTASEPALVEAFVTGPECHVDAIVVRGEIVLLTVGFYLTNVMSTTHLLPTGSCIVPHHEDPDLYARAADLIARAAPAFGVRDGVLHLEAFDTAEGLVFSECGFRRAGGKSSETVALSTGTDYRELACLASLRLLEPMPLRLPSRAAAWVMVKAPAGTVRALPRPEDFAGVPGLEEAVVDRSLLGRVVAGMPGAYERAGHVIVTGTDAASTRAAVTRAGDLFRAATVVEGA